MLEGHLRGTMAAWSPEAIREDRIKFGNEVKTTADDNLRGLGLHLDTLTIQRVESR